MSLTLNDLRVVTRLRKIIDRPVTVADLVEILPTIGAETIVIDHERPGPELEDGTWLVLKVDEAVKREGR